MKECKPRGLCLELCDQNHFPFKRFHLACSDLVSAFDVRLRSVAIYEVFWVDLTTCEDLENYLVLVHCHWS